MKKLFFLLFISIISVACSNSDDDNIFSGNWKGIYNGTDNGNWIMTVSETGNITGTVHSVDYNQDFTVSGTVNDNGQLNAVIGSVSNGGVFTGQLNGNSGNGTWSNNLGTPHSGNWSGNKQ